MRIDFPAPAHVPQLLRLWKAVFGEYGGFWELFRDTAFSAQRCRCLFDGETLAASLCWFDVQCTGQKMAYIYAVVTDPTYRGRGLCRTLMEDTHHHLAAQGYAASLLVPAEERLRVMYKKMDYIDCTAVTEFSCSAGSCPVSLRAIGPEEYARLRRQFLPKDGVLQEEESLRFLAQQAQFYAGADFLMAAYTEGTTLHAMELLGDDRMAPGIVTALECRKGIFRTPGGEKQFAMFHPLRKDAAIPGYFGFAFD